MTTITWLRCGTCDREMNDRAETVWQKVTGWEHRREQGGTNHISLREPLQEFMCEGCMTRRKMGIDVGQASLL